MLKLHGLLLIKENIVRLPEETNKAVAVFGRELKLNKDLERVHAAGGVFDVEVSERVKDFWDANISEAGPE